ncbi:MAG: hypothetical protein H7832_07960 [Magnetococcus sp. DMHC-6]
MEATFNANNIFQAMVGLVQFAPEKRLELLKRMAENFSNDPKLSKDTLKDGLKKSLEMGVISSEEVKKYFKDYQDL